MIQSLEAMAKDSHPVADLVLRLYPALLARLRYRVGRAESEDIVQDLYLRIRGLPKDREIREPRSYIFRAADNLATDAARRASPYADDLPDVADAAPGVDQTIDARRRLRALRATIEAMPERQRTAFVLAKYHGLSQDQIAERMGISRSGVEKLLVKAMSRCRAALEDLA